jgi:hypothetical protein
MMPVKMEHTQTLTLDAEIGLSRVKRGSGLGYGLLVGFGGGALKLTSQRGSVCTHELTLELFYRHTT